MVAGDARTWKEDESTFDLIAGALRDSAIAGPLAVEATSRLFIVEHVTKASGNRREVGSGQKLGIRRCLASSAADLGHGEAGPGDRTRDGEARHCGRRHRPGSARILRAEELEQRLWLAGLVASDRPWDRNGRA